jgi:hypothetical protein
MWNQQKTILLKNEDLCPRLLFILDLEEEVKKWLEAGDQLVIGLDVNDDVRRCLFSLVMSPLGLAEVVTHKHGPAGPETYHKGSEPIDGIYVSITLRHGADI